ncbi:hypothetical protein H5410_032733 [Solanum commersonii]|uniref:TYRAAT2-like C-terminal domain-containing protein n=1 Tax=Solanum commersonii TaxID=4109 RepID=A0A9J5YKS2_SOLCO|nr:hypothetical protein H5410_032733 [Solanum commersonii]
MYIYWATPPAIQVVGLNSHLTNPPAAAAATSPSKIIHLSIKAIDVAQPYDYEDQINMLSQRNTLFVDVLSVKEFPKNISLQVLPIHFDILCTHPMFGPESGRSRTTSVDKFLDIFEKEGCVYDKLAADSQFITHTMGRVLTSPTPPINTKGYENLVENAASDSFDLYSGMFMYDKNAMEELERLDLALKELFGHLHDLTAPSLDALKSQNN